MGIKDALEAFRDGVQDLVTLEVYTYGGTLEQTTDIASNGKTLNWENFKPDGTSNLKLVAATQVMVDLDAVNFQSSDTSISNRAELITLHKATLESSQSGRAEMLKTFTSMLTDGFGGAAGGN